MSKLTSDFLREMFSGLGPNGDPNSFFAHVADDVKWTVSNPGPEKYHPLSGFYESAEDFKAATFKPLGEALQNRLRLKITQDPIVTSDGTRAVVELQTSEVVHSPSPAARMVADVCHAAATDNGSIPVGKNGKVFDNRYAWVLEYDSSKEKIVTVRAYLDSAAVNAVMN